MGVACKHIPDGEVLRVVVEAPAQNRRAYDVLAERYPAKVAWAKLERLSRRGWLECGVSLACPWLTPAGAAALHRLESAGYC